MHGGVSVTVEVRREVVDEKLSQGWADAEAKDLDEAIRMADEAAKAKKPLAILICANMVDICEEAVEKGWIARYRHRDVPVPRSVRGESRRA